MLSTKMTKRKRTVIPAVNKVRCIVDTKQDEDGKVSVLELNNFTDLLENIDRIEVIKLIVY